jgi:signal transduction histidine kinase
MYNRFNILQKGLTLFAIPLLAQVVLLCALIKVQSDGVTARHWAVHTKEVITRVDETHLALVEGYTGVNSLLFSGNSSTSELYQNTQAQVPRRVDGLRRLVEDNPQQRSRVSVLGDRAHSLLSWLAAQEQLIRSGQRDLAMARIPQGTRLLADIRTSVEEILREEAGLDRDRVEALHRSAELQLWTLVGGSVAIMVTTMSLVLVFLQGISRRLAVVRDNARRFSAGRALEPPLAGTDEITDVDRAFHEMAGTLNHQKQENEMFVYSVSHDLRSPLVNLEGFSVELSLSCRDLQVLFQREDVPAAVRQRGLELVKRDIAESVHFIQSAVERLGRIIDALLRLSRAGRVEYRWQSIDVAAIVQRIVEALHDTLSARKAEVGVGELPPAWGDSTAVEQIFANLIGNSAQYLDPARPGRIEVGTIPSDGLGKPAGHQVYYVKDNGLGIPEGYHQRVFTAFNRLHADVAQGEGIGLALVRRMVERHGGRIWLESSAGVGTTFFVALPANSATGAGERAGSAQAIHEPQGVHDS